MPKQNAAGSAKQTKSSHIISAGHCRALGATIEADGVNFAVWCPQALNIELLLFKTVNDDAPEVIALSSNVFKSNYFWHVKVRGIGAGQIYAYRIRRAQRTSSSISNVMPGKVLLDPYGRRVLFPDEYQRFQGEDDAENLRCSAKSAVVDMDAYDWGLDIHPRHPLNRTVIYEMHVKGFTAHPSSGLSSEVRGTYRGLIEKIPYLVSMGITAVELLPVYQFDEQDALPGKKNYWGYSPMNFFAPHEAYAQDRSLMGPINEFRDLVKALHQANIEVILDVVYNHTSEGDSRGPVYCFKGLDTHGYYIVNDEGNFGNFSGCGNTLNATNPVVRTMILDSLVFWREQMHVDGFRFDLASILSRDPSGMPLAASPTLLDIDANRHLADAKIIAEPWDAGGLYQLGSIAGTKWREWNGKFRDDVRSFIRGDNGALKNFVLRILGSPDVYNEHNVDPQKSINFITCHDGFTLWDLVCYTQKHNLDNGEDNRDGNDANYSANYGYEGEFPDDTLNQLRLRQVKNMMVTNLLSMGTPMICMGDEVLRTQRGNNNAYCQDNELSYLNWNFTPMQKDMLKFTQRLIKLRTHGKLQSKANEATVLNKALRNSKLQWHGVKPFQPDWSDGSHSIGILVYYGEFGLYAYVFFNAYWQDLTIELPPPPNNVKRKWIKIVDTSEEKTSQSVLPRGQVCYHAGDKLVIEARSVVMFMSIGT
ncbi:MAG: isoamylase [Succinivibrio sp.]|nr:isoamylase [Succinivibrio sp.]